jgi:hypothetical protein
MSKNYVSSIRPWLKNNLGAKCLAVLTGQDSAALDTAVCAAVLWARSDMNARENAAAAFRGAVLCMQPTVRHFAYHSVAHIADWGHRSELWTDAGLWPSEKEVIFPGCVCGREAGRPIRLVALVSKAAR